MMKTLATPFCDSLAALRLALSVEYLLILLLPLDCHSTDTANPTSVFWIEENFAQGSLVGQLSDAYGTNGAVVKSHVYTSLAEGPAAIFFRVDPQDGTIYASKTIDREALCEDVPVRRNRDTNSTSEASDGTTNRRKRSAKEKYFIHKEVRRKEDEALSGNSRPIRSAHIFANRFQQTTCQVKFQVHVRTVTMDGINRSSLQDVQIMIADVNDNIPAFYTKSVILKIPESSPIDAEFRLPMATDADSGIHGITDYKLFRAVHSKEDWKDEYACASNSGKTQHQSVQQSSQEKSEGSRENGPNFAGDYFVLIPTTQMDGLLQPILKQIRPLDREKTDALYFCLVAEDGGGNLGFLMVKLEILDVNDNVPQWQGLPYRVTVPECEQMEKDANGMYLNSPYYGAQSNDHGWRLIYTLHAQDEDSGINGQISYRLGQQNSHLFKGPNKFSNMPSMLVKENKVFVTSMLDFEKLNRFFVPVEAVDGGGLANFTEIEVLVEDCNDHAPTIKVIPLNIPDSVRNASASHLDDTATVWVTEEDESAVDLATVMAQDRDQQDSGKVMCHLGSRDSNAEASVGKLFDLIPSEIGTQTNNLHYSAKKESGGDRTRSHNIFTLYKREGQKIDREKTPSFVLTIVCNDNGPRMVHETKKVVYVVVTDTNDNKPNCDTTSFSDSRDKSRPIPTQTLSVPENEPFGTLVGSVYATDLDEGLNARLTYSFADLAEFNNQSSFENGIKLTSGRDLFELDAKTGKLYTRASLDRESNASYVIFVRVADSGVPPLSSVVRLIIHVSDVNDSPPVFLTTPGASGRILFKTEESNGDRRIHGRLIGQLKAFDADNGANRSIRYELDEGSVSPSGLPVIYRITTEGKIYADGLLDREECPQHQFTVRAVDGGPSGHQLTASAVVVVHLTDLNDSPPRFVSPSSGGNAAIPSDLINITTDTPPGSILYRIQATDNDEPSNTRLRFTLRSAKFLSEYFSLRQIDSHPRETNDFTETGAHLILTNSLTQLPSLHSSSQDASYPSQHISFPQPKEYFIYIIVKDSDEEPSHSCTCRLQIHVYQDGHLDSASYQETKTNDTIHVPAPLVRKTDYNIYTPSRNPSASGGSAMKTDEYVHQRGVRMSGTTVILVMAIIIICVFLGVFCFVAFLYLRGIIQARRPSTTMQNNLSAKATFTGNNLPGAVNYEDEMLGSERAAYWEVLNQPGVMNKDNITCSRLTTVPLDRKSVTYIYPPSIVSPDDERCESVQLGRLSRLDDRFEQKPLGGKDYHTQRDQIDFLNTGSEHTKGFGEKEAAFERPEDALKTSRNRMSPVGPLQVVSLSRQTTLARENCCAGVADVSRQRYEIPSNYHPPPTVSTFLVTETAPSLRKHPSGKAEDLYPRVRPSTAGEHSLVELNKNVVSQNELRKNKEVSFAQPLEDMVSTLRSNHPHDTNPTQTAEPDGDEHRYESEPSTPYTVLTELRCFPHDSLSGAAVKNWPSAGAPSNSGSDLTSFPETSSESHSTHKISNGTKTLE
ncbi:unnamed protein product [Calicophoron daubneyi]|uniref:Cadherin domain-containing protein n=1 Tax=Calicophoron daubneyi TaxID=300641 RepID=A0AAV2TAC3_CALDB